jgi:hypothetical protein
MPDEILTHPHPTTSHEKLSTPSSKGCPEEQSASFINAPYLPASLGYEIGYASDGTGPFIWRLPVDQNGKRDFNKPSFAVMPATWLTGATEQNEGNTHLEFEYLINGAVRFARMPLALLQDKKELAKFLFDRGLTFPTTPVGIHNVAEYFRQSWELRRAAGLPDVAVSELGWNKSKTVFNLSDVAISKDAMKRAHVVSATEIDLSPRGMLDRWAHAVARFDGHPKHCFVILAAAAAPLYTLIKSRPPVLSIIGETGVGKTLAAMAAVSIFGPPNSLMIDPDSTTNAIFENWRYLSDLPVLLDEVTKLTSDDKKRAKLKELILSAANGMPKSRSKRDGSNGPKPKPFTTTSIFTCNQSLRELDRLFLPAELTRILEINITENEGLSLSNGEGRRMAQIFSDEQHGRAGRALINYVVENNAEAIKILLEAEKWVNAQKLPEAERFNAQQLAAVKAAGIIGKQLGLFFFDVEAPVSMALDTIKQQVATTKTSSDRVRDALTDFINTNAGRFMYAAATDKGHTIFDFNREPRTSIVGLQKTLTNKDIEVSISYSEFQKFALDRHIGAAHINQYCKRSGVVRKNVRISPVSRPWCLVYTEPKHENLQILASQVESDTGETSAIN